MTFEANLRGKRRECKDSPSRKYLPSKRIRGNSASEGASWRSEIILGTTKNGKSGRNLPTTAGSQSTSHEIPRSLLANDGSSSSLSSLCSDIVDPEVIEHDATTGCSKPGAARNSDLQLTSMDICESPVVMAQNHEEQPRTLSSPSPKFQQRPNIIQRDEDNMATQKEYSAAVAREALSLTEDQTKSEAFQKCYSPKISASEINPLLHSDQSSLRVRTALPFGPNISKIVVSNPNYHRGLDGSNSKKPAILPDLPNIAPNLRPNEQPPESEILRTVRSATPAPTGQVALNIGHLHSPRASEHRPNLAPQRPPTGPDESPHKYTDTLSNQQTQPPSLIDSGQLWSNATNAFIISQSVGTPQPVKDSCHHHHIMRQPMTGVRQPNDKSIAQAPFLSLKQPHYTTTPSQPVGNVEVRTGTSGYQADIQGVALLPSAHKSSGPSTYQRPSGPAAQLSNGSGSHCSQPPQRPAVIFTLDNRAESNLPSATVASLMETISRVSSILLRPKEVATKDHQYSVGAVLWTSLPDFCNWYTHFSQTARMTNFRFLFPDMNAPAPIEFMLPADSAESFRDLKQTVWDLFWMAYHSSNSTLKSFTILIFPDVEVKTTVREFPPEEPGILSASRSQSCDPTGTPAASYLDRSLDCQPSASFTAPLSRQRSFASPPALNNNLGNISTHGTVVASLISGPASLPQSAAPVRPFGDFRGHAVTPHSPRAVDITLRLQIDAAGRFSSEYDKDFLRPKVTTEEFFSWFATQTGYCAPHGPVALSFVLMNAMPAYKEDTVKNGNEEHFTYLRKEIKAQFAKANEFLPGLREFVVLIKVPGWAQPEAEEVW